MQIKQSRLQQEDSFYLKYDERGVTQLVHQDEDFQTKSSYREIHKMRNEDRNQEQTVLFVDKEYQINLGTQFEEDDTVIIRRLSTLYASNRPPFINTEADPSRPKNPTKVPHCLNELPIFSTFHYKTFFMTQDYQKSGKYTVIVNIDGRFEVITVDDFIPIHKDTLCPIWDMSYNNPWELILIKVWAKKLKGYNLIPQARPFEFIEAFSNPTWKYFNINRSLQDFLKKYTDFNKLRNAKIILKSKNKEQIRNNGILPNSCSYELVGGGMQLKNGNVKQYNLVIQSTTKSHWCGQLSYLDKKSIQAFRQINPQISFERGFMMNSEDLQNNFAAAYVTSKRQNGYYTGYRILDIVEGQKKAQHFEFHMPKDGFIDFSIKQFPENAISSAQSKIQGTSLSNNMRYLKTKYILVKDNQYERNGEQEQYSYNYKPQQSRIGGSSIANSNIERTTNHHFKTPRFSVYEIEYLKGYNKGEAHFLSIPRGRYILRVKSQLINKPASYSLNWVCSEKVQFIEASLSKEQKVELIHNAIVSIMHKEQHYSLQKGRKTEMITYGQTFQEIGYGYFAVKSSLDSPFNILLEVNPNKLAEQGYILKGRYKDEKEPFNICIPPGQFDSVVLKLDKKSKQYIWPTQAFRVWKKETKPQTQIVEEKKEQEQEKYDPNLLHSDTKRIPTNNNNSNIKKTPEEDNKASKGPQGQKNEQKKVEEQNKAIDQWGEEAQL